MPKIVKVLGVEKLNAHRASIALGLEDESRALDWHMPPMSIYETAYSVDGGLVLPSEVYLRLIGLISPDLLTELLYALRGERTVGDPMRYYLLSPEDVAEAPHVTDEALSAFGAACTASIASEVAVEPDPPRWIDYGAPAVRTVNLLQLAFERGPGHTILARAVFESEGRQREYHFRCDDENPLVYAFRADVRSALHQMLSVGVADALERQACESQFYPHRLPPGGLVLGVAAEDLIRGVRGVAGTEGVRDAPRARATAYNDARVNYSFPSAVRYADYVLPAEYQQQIMNNFHGLVTPPPTSLVGWIGAGGPIPQPFAAPQAPVADAIIRLCREEDTVANSVTFTVTWEGGEIAEVSKDLVKSHVWFIELRSEALVPAPEGDPRRMLIGTRNYPVIYESLTSYFIKREALLDEPLTPNTDDGPF